MEFGSILRQLRIEAGLTQSDLADELNVTNQAISKWERGDNYPEITLLPRLASRFQVSVDMLLGNERPLSSEELRVLFDKCQSLLASGMIEKAISLTQEAVDRDNRNQELKLALAELLVQVSESESDAKKRDAFLRRAAALLEAVIAVADDPRKKLKTKKSLMRIWYRLGQKDRLFEMTEELDEVYHLRSKSDLLDFFKGNDRVFAAQGVIHDAAIEILQGLDALTDDSANGKPILSPLVSEEKKWNCRSDEKQELLMLGIDLFDRVFGSDYRGMVLYTAWQLAMKLGRLYLKDGDRSIAIDILKRAEAYAMRMDSDDGLDTAVRRFQHLKQEVRSKTGTRARDLDSTLQAMKLMDAYSRELLLKPISSSPALSHLDQVNFGPLYISSSPWLSSRMLVELKSPAFSELAADPEFKEIENDLAATAPPQTTSEK